MHIFTHAVRKQSGRAEERKSGRAEERKSGRASVWEGASETNEITLADTKSGRKGGGSNGRTITEDAMRDEVIPIRAGIVDAILVS